WLFVQRDSKE
nr:Chain C, 10-residue peptide [synthetic construct]3G1B_D Chain D, 10-residue peptide [synthetic construct]3GQ1_C Chain C, WLFVQRDSKE peptide [synthetic construct]3GQ1_D Chain D, WLFVQRDSKE peptide [synthetic construct]